MKKTLAILCIMVLLVTACGKAEQINSVEEVTSGATTAVTEEVKQPEPEVVQEEEIEKEAENEQPTDTAVVNLDDYVGYYSDGGDTEVTIKKDGAEYSMEIFIYRLTTIDEGKVTASPEGVVLDALDANGDPIKILFYKNTDDSYAFEIKETTWMYFENGTVYDKLTKTDSDKVTTSGNSGLEDGVYYTCLVSSQPTYSQEYISSIEFSDDKVFIDAVFSKVENDFDWTPVDKDTYIIAIDSNTKYLAGGGEDDPEVMSKDQFIEYINQLMDSGLGLRIVIENGYATEMGIWS